MAVVLLPSRAFGASPARGVNDRGACISFAAGYRTGSDVRARRSDAAADKADCARADLMAALILLAGAATQGAVELTSSNFESKIGSKHAFVKFLAPW